MSIILLLVYVVQQTAGRRNRVEGIDSSSRNFLTIDVQTVRFLLHPYSILNIQNFVLSLSQQR